MQYQTRKIDIINNHDHIQFYELELNGKRLFSEFYEGLRDVKDKKSFHSIVSMMDCYSFTEKFPEKKIRHILGTQRKDIYEFKKNNIRVYAILQKPNVFIIIGGYKANQPKDIEKIDRYTKQLPEILTIQK